MSYLHALATFMEAEEAWGTDMSFREATGGRATMSTALFLLSGELPPAVAPGGIVDPWNYTAGITPGGWVSIYGTYLAPGAAEWAPQPGAPVATTLNSVTVRIDGGA